MDLERRLIENLEMTPDQVRARVESEWAERSGGRPLVLFGAGNLGRKVRRALAGTPLEVVAFADNDPARWGTTLEGLPVMEPGTAAARFGREACFVVTIFRAEGTPHRYPETEAALRGAGALRVAHFGHLARVRPEGLLPHYALDLPERMAAARNEVWEGLACFGEPESRDVYLRHALWRMTLDFGLLGPADAREIYFPADLVRPGPGQVLADVGAYDGDTCRRMLEIWGARARAIHAFEPDPATAGRFRVWLEGTPGTERVRLHEIALGSSPGTVHFQGTGHLNAAPSPEGAAVPRRTLDAVLEAEPPDFIKMDIEGAELDALLGAPRILAREPEMAVCLYHVQDHLWSVPRLVRAQAPGLKLRLRYHGSDGWELVMYATRT
jgi:FkbM family methyltransferase